MSGPIEDVKRLLASTTGAARKDLLRELQEIVVSEETPEDTAMRIAFYPCQAATARIGHELKIFEILTNSSPKTLDELHGLTNAHSGTLGRLLRFMASFGLIREAGVNLFEANQQCRNLATPESAVTLKHFFHNLSPIVLELPTFLRDNNYGDVATAKTTVMQAAYKTDLDTYTWMAAHPASFKSFIEWMENTKVDRLRWMEAYPVEREAKDLDPELAVFVDIGGNVGYFCAQFKDRFPNMPGRVILQDIPGTLEHVSDTSGFEVHAHDFFKPQPIKGAKFYHLSWILHNWHDEEAKQILTQITTAMTAQSVVLINDFIMPEKEVPTFVAALDMIMLNVFGTRERTLKEWSELLDDVGLVVQQHYVYDTEHCYGVIGAVLK